MVVTSDNADLIRNQSATFTGNVVIYQQQQTVSADSAIYNEQTSQFTASGNIELSSSSAQVKGQSIFIDEQNKDFELLDAQYQFGFNAGRGNAEKFSIENNNKLLLENASFTTCPGENPSWLFLANEININQSKGWGEAWNTVFKLGDVPIIWVPYVTFPITDQRKSGLLFPEFGNSTRYGTYFSQPIYFNLAPNYDLTVTPKYMSERGLLMQGNFRHLSTNSSNTLQLEYLNEDESEPSLGGRYLSYWQHESLWSDNWNLKLQLTDLGDDNYISEFGSDYHHIADTHLNNFISLHYYGETIDFDFLSQDMSELGPQVASYKIPAQLSIDWHNAKTTDIVQWNLASQYTLFEHEQLELDRVQRLHFEPEITFNWVEPAYQLLISSSYLSTHYKKENTLIGESEDVSRGLLKHRLLAGLNFEKEASYFGQKVRQTLEPKIQYLYTEESDQSKIGLYDSQKLKEDYFSLFRDNSYSGLDRIEAKNQATLGFSTSIFNDKNKELFRFGMAQIFKFQDFNGTNSQETSSNNSATAIEWFGQLSERWQIDGGVLYNQDQSQVDTGFISLDYWLAKDKNFQLNYRYADDLAGVEINQTGIFASYQISPEWAAATSYHYDIKTGENLDALVGLEYRTCCWSIQLAAQRQVVVDLNEVQFNDETAIKYDNGISINFKISGMGGDISSSIADLFSDSIFAYRRPYLITN